MRVVSLVYIVSYLLPLLIFLIFKRKEKEVAVRVILFYTIYCLLQEGLTFLVSMTFPSLRDYLIYLFVSYTLIEFSFFCLFYYYLFPKGHAAQKATIAVWAAFVIFGLLDYFMINKHQQFDSFVSGIESIILILMCGYYLYYQVTHTLSMMVYNTFNFWVIVTFFMFVSATFFLYLLTDTMGKDPSFRNYYLFINFGANFLKNLLLAYAFTRPFLKAPKEKESRVSTVDLGDELILPQKS